MYFFAVTPWTMTHAHFLQMGGFRLVCTKEENAEGPIESALSEKADFMGMGMGRRVKAWGRFFIPHYISFRSPHHPRFVEGALLFDAFVALLETGRLRFPSDVTAADIKDKSKSDALSKGFALLQISWFVLQIVARVREGMAVTELELTTAVLAGMNGLTYLFWWDKPVDVRRPLVLRTRAVEMVVFARVHAREGAAEARFEEMEMEHVWDFQTDEAEEGAKARTRDRWKACVLVVSKSVYSALISIPGHVSQTVSDSVQSTTKFMRSVVRAIYDGVSNWTRWFHSPAPTPLTHAPFPPDFPRPGSPNRPVNRGMRLSPLGMSLLTLERVLHPLAYPLRLLIAMPANALLAHGLWNVMPTDDRSPAREFYLAKSQAEAKPVVLDSPSAVEERLKIICEGPGAESETGTDGEVGTETDAEGEADAEGDYYEGAEAESEGEGETKAEGEYADAREKYHGKSARAMMWDESDMRWVMHMIFLSVNTPSPSSTSSSNSTSTSSSDTTGQKRLFYTGAAAGTLFGGLHCLAWGFAFPSGAERVVWRAAALAIVGLSLAVLAGAWAYEVAYAQYWNPGAGVGMERTKRCFIGMLLLKKLAGVPCVLYPLARAVLLIVALTSLRDLPESALRTVEWTRVIPHV